MIKAEQATVYRCRHGRLWPDAEKAAHCDMNHALTDAHNAEADRIHKKRKSEPSLMRYWVDRQAGVVDDAGNVIEKKLDAISCAMLPMAQENERDTILFWIMNNFQLLETLISIWLDREPVDFKSSEETKEPRAS